MLKLEEIPFFLVSSFHFSGNFFFRELVYLIYILIEEFFSWISIKAMGSLIAIDDLSCILINH